MNENNENKPLTVFVSYSWDGPSHEQWVLNLADKLSSETDLHVIFDRYDIALGKSTTHFMENAVTTADKVIMVLTPEYKEKADDRARGVGYEYSMVTQALYENQGSGKFIPVRRKGNYNECTPIFIKQFMTLDMSNDLTFDQDFGTLVRAIYEEPQIKRPPAGKRPEFLTDNRHAESSSSLIDEKVVTTNSRLKHYARWTFIVRLRSLDNVDFQGIYNQVRANLARDPQTKRILPEIFNGNYLVSHSPQAVFEIPPHPGMATNHLCHEKVMIAKGVIRYEFCEYVDHSMILLFLMQPFLTMMHLLSVLRRIHTKLGLTPDIDIGIGYQSDRKSLLYGPHSPFSYPNYNNLQTMVIANNRAETDVSLKGLSTAEVFSFFQKVYFLFVAENPKAASPFISLDQSDFDKRYGVYFE